MNFNIKYTVKTGRDEIEHYDDITYVPFGYTVTLVVAASPSGKHELDLPDGVYTIGKYPPLSFHTDLDELEALMASDLDQFVMVERIVTKPLPTQKELQSNDII